MKKRNNFRLREQYIDAVYKAANEQQCRSMGEWINQLIGQKLQAMNINETLKEESNANT